MLELPASSTMKINWKLLYEGRMGMKLFHVSSTIGKEINMLLDKEIGKSMWRASRSHPTHEQQETNILGEIENFL